MAARAVGIVDEALLGEQRRGIVAARADGRAAAKAGQRGSRFAQVIALQLGLLGDTVFPHVVGELVAICDRRAERLGVELAYPARRENGGLDGMRLEQLEQPPNADAAA